MQKKIKFKPKITRIRLNPDQAVLSCDCFNKGKYVVVATVNSRGASFIQDVSSHPWDGVACNYNTKSAKVPSNVIVQHWGFQKADNIASS